MHNATKNNNSTRANSNDHPDHMVTDTLPMYVSNSVHHMPMETALHPESTTLLYSLLSSSCSTTSNSCSINIASGNCIVHSNGSSYTVNMVHVTYCCLQALSDPIGSLIDAAANGGSRNLSNTCQ